jgi:hypothetical protein
MDNCFLRHVAITTCAGLTCERTADCSRGGRRLSFAFAISFRFLLCVRVFYMDHAVLVCICVDLIFAMLWRGGGRKTRRVERDRALCPSVLEVDESYQSPWAKMPLASFSLHAHRIEYLTGPQFNS